MARNKNALRQHFVQAYEAGKEPTEEGWLPLAHYISNIGVEPNESTEEEAFYDGDGTLQETVTGVARAYTPEGFYDPEDAAQQLIADMQDEVGDNRKLWHKVIRADGKVQWVGEAMALNIIAGAGEASTFEEFSCTIRFIEKPEKSEVTPGGSGE